MKLFDTKVQETKYNVLREAAIDYDNCISCGSCVYTCPFGATVDTSSIVDVINSIKESKEKDSNNPTVAIVAPSIGSQFLYASLGQVITGIHKLGFAEVFEVALGADMVAPKEAEELVEKRFLTSSCCPAFVKYIETKFPEMVEHISHNHSPMVELAKFLKEGHPEYKIVFIGPCISKKAEVRKPEPSKYVDYAITFEELQALFDSRDIDIRQLEETDFEFDPIVCSGIEKCKPALNRAKKGLLPNNFIEGMACVGGCVGGSGNLVRYQEELPKAMAGHIDDATAVEILQNVQKTKEKL